MMTREQIHERIATLAEELTEHHTVIAANHPQDEEGYPVISDPDLADAMRVIDYATSVLSRLAFNM